jgi:cytochrome c oxidase assembly protein subunit 15
VSAVTDVAGLTPSTTADRMAPVRVWLYVMAALVLLMVVVGGITRLTESGLSIVSWKPIAGIIPPLTAADWQAEFDAYKLIPQYEVLNSWMTLSDFQGIFWWEWSHRFLGRLLGFAFAIPFLVFLVQRRFTWSLAAPLAGLFILGGLQGALGWWMVSSGLSELTSVSQYRLAAHLSAAAVLLMALVWVPRRLETFPPSGAVSAASLWGAGILLVLLLLQIAAGAFVAGLDAGMGYNTWPLMDGALIPSGLDVMNPFWKNLFENALTVQFNHRMIAYAITAFVAFLLWRQRRAGGFPGVHRWLPWIAALILVQVALGVATLLTAVRLDVAVPHQAVAFILLAAVTAYLADMSRVRYAGTHRSQDGLTN